MNIAITNEHRWLQQLTGRWQVTFDMQDHPLWQEDVRLLDGLWSIAELSGPMPDGNSATMIMTLGYDPALHRFVGSTIGTMMSNLWVYDGGLDETGTILTLDCEGPDMTDAGRTARYRDIITIIDADTRRFSSRMENADGSWNPVMASHYKRMAAT
ncbi:DUF1579 domain-containing protein [Pararhizobium antarcticum]|uniref:DUF1579 domain-containing protein n=1 Tax=Pararhizobium antarcticum TaxID=1798805 RepID=A0A657M2F9_9HYPH|nr:DUF1579 domain-containing protein [Pararhizobium antarcticum]OJF96633.1 hypothetical protein AX761_03430 [Rhizobium sp. 58]OJG01360.1 hypothetical protein AX760_00090 [Pararhizobium antarcticum]